MELGAALGPGAAQPFADWPDPTVPLSGGGVYAIWDGAGRFLYAGMAGAAEGRGGLRQRLTAHAAGRRSGDQFCVYVADRLVLPALTAEAIAAIASGQDSLDAMVRELVRDTLRYAWIACAPLDARAIEATLKRGDWPHGPPLLNPAGAEPEEAEAPARAPLALPRRRPIRL